MGAGGVSEGAGLTGGKPAGGAAVCPATFPKTATPTTTAPATPIVEWRIVRFIGSCCMFPRAWLRPICNFAKTHFETLRIGMRPHIFNRRFTQIGFWLGGRHSVESRLGLDG